MTKKELFDKVLEKGYIATQSGDIFSPSGKKLKLHFKGKDGNRYHKYYRFSVSIDKKVHKVLVHRYIAYQKFGEKIFKKGIQVRHIDDNSENNCFNNIGIGNQSENKLDEPAMERSEISKRAIRTRRANANI